MLKLQNIITKDIANFINIFGKLKISRITKCVL